jgi:hypothetical protein
VARLGFDLATSFVSSGLTLLLSAAGLIYAEQLGYTVPQLYAIGGAAFLIVGALWGLLAVATGRK